MPINYRVYTKVAAHSPWRFTGVIESDKSLAEKVWADIILRTRQHAFKLEWCTYGVCIER